MGLRSKGVRSPLTRPDPKRSDQVSVAAVAVAVDAETVVVVVVAAVDETVGSFSI
jgi:hypothetical protein